MKKQSGFTLIELMVVMAIIAILATAGLSAYTGYIKKARDTTRIADIGAINTIILGQLSTSGNVPTLAELQAAILAANNNATLADPLGTSVACLTSNTDTTLVACGYKYKVCDGNTGYGVATKFESTSNAGTTSTTGMYYTDDIGVNDLEYYELGTCNVACTAGSGGCPASGSPVSYTAI